MKAVSHAEAAALANAYEVAIQREPEGEARLGYDRIVLWSLGREDPQLLSQLLSRKGASPQAGDLR